MSTPESAYGGPIYDAQVNDLADAAEVAIEHERLQQATDMHLFYDKRAAAEVYSHVYDPIPNPTAVAIMGLAHERDLIVAATSRQWDYPFPGAELGPIPSFSRAPDTSPIIGDVSHHLFGAHRIEPARHTRARFGTR